MQELKDAEEAHGAAAAEVTKDVKLTGRQKAVLGIIAMTFAVAIGGFNLLAPTSGAVAGVLARAKIEWTTWLKVALKLIVVLTIVCAVILTIACVMI